MKTCTKCKIEKPFIEFNKDNWRIDGYNRRCRTCLCKIQNAYYYKNIDKFKVRNKAVWAKIKLNRPIPIKLSDEEIKEIKRKKQVESTRKYKLKLKENPKIFDPIAHREQRDKTNTRIKKRRKNDPMFRFKCSLRARIWVVFKRNSYTKEATQKLIGVSYELAKRHIERQFKKGMNWSNHGKNGWHIDHKIPLDIAKNVDELAKLCHYTNLQPLWGKDNWKKNNKIIETQTVLPI